MNDVFATIFSLISAVLVAGSGLLLPDQKLLAIHMMLLAVVTSIWATNIG